MQLPSDEEIAENLEGWKDYSDNLVSRIHKLEVIRDHCRDRGTLPSIISTLFDIYVSDVYPQKIFDKSCLKILRKNKYEYYYDGVFIRFFGYNLRWPNKEWEYKEDCFISVDGIVVRNDVGV
jgi:hypothetical protein